MSFENIAEGLKKGLIDVKEVIKPRYQDRLPQLVCEETQEEVETY